VATMLYATAKHGIPCNWDDFKANDTCRSNDEKLVILGKLPFLLIVMFTN
jgi:hypothetical protein